MDYYEIGQRIRKFRKACGLSQEELAEKIGISATHMSHIETGNTKLSLQVLVSLAECLEVRTDDLLFSTKTEEDGYYSDEISDILSECTAKERSIIYEIVKATKVSLKKYS